MALHIQMRHDNASVWTSTNPVLASGEPGVELDTGKFKIGNGVTAWNSLAYQGSTGATQTAPYRSLGDGSDGTVIITSGTTTLVRDMFYDNLSISGTGKIVTNGYRIFVRNTLDLSGAPTGAINNNGFDGGNASGATGGTAASVPASTNVLGQSPGTNGATATTAAGTASVIPGVYNGGGGSGASAGAGGLGNAGAGGGASTSRTPGLPPEFRRFETSFLTGTTLLGGGIGGAGGGSGAGDNVFTATGGGGGAGGSGGGVVAIYANCIVKSSTTSAGAIQAIGGNGGNGGNGAATLGATGGGGGGGAGGGGWIYIAYNDAYGPVINNLIIADGGVGGIGGSPFNGVGTGLGGSGGSAASGGRINIYRIPNQTGTVVEPFLLTTIISEAVGTTPRLTVNTVGGSGGFGSMSRLSF